MILAAAAVAVGVSAICLVKGGAEFPSGHRTETGQSNAEIVFRRIMWTWRVAGVGALAFAIGGLIAGFPP